MKIVAGTLIGVPLIVGGFFYILGWLLILYTIVKGYQIIFSLWRDL